MTQDTPNQFNCNYLHPTYATSRSSDVEPLQSTRAFVSCAFPPIRQDLLRVAGRLAEQRNHPADALNRDLRPTHLPSRCFCRTHATSSVSKLR